jgi:predicted DCC family thiol-disulfide oxidoreductase YuxK
MIRRYLANPWQSAAVALLLAAGRKIPWAYAAAAVLFAACEIEAGFRRREGSRWIPSEWPRPGEPLTVLYDATCVLCVGSMKRLESWKTAGEITFVPLQSPEARAMVPGIPEERLLGQMHVIEKGQISSGADGWFRIMSLAPLPLAWLAWVTPRALARPVYNLVARNRYRWFGRVCEGGSCSLHAGPRL